MVFEKDPQTHPLNTHRAITFLALAALSAQARACAVCMGSDNQQIADASNSVLWSLLALVGFIFVATGATAFFLWRKANAPIPPHIALVESLTTEPDID